MKYLDTKQPSEEYHVTFSFAGDLEDDSITSYTVTVTDESGNDVTTDLTDAAENSASGQDVVVYLKGGEDGKTYKYTIEVTAATSGYKFEGDAQLRVVDQ